MGPSNTKNTRKRAVVIETILIFFRLDFFANLINPMRYIPIIKISNGECLDYQDISEINNLFDYKKTLNRNYRISSRFYHGKIFVSVDA